MGYCTNEEYEEFLRSCPEFERMLIRSGIILIKYWFSISDSEQENRFQDRIKDPTKRWKISQMDVESRDKWVEYSMAKDKMFSYTDTKQSPWYVVPADDKRRARLNSIDHFLSPNPLQRPYSKAIQAASAEARCGLCQTSDHGPDIRSGKILITQPPWGGHTFCITCKTNTSVEFRQNAFIFLLLSFILKLNDEAIHTERDT